MTRDVNRDTAMVKNMRMYNITVFFAMRLLSDEDADTIIYFLGFKYVYYE
jgi:hypothetical protein